MNTRAVIFIFVLIAFMSVTRADSGFIDWQPPLQNEDGSALTNLAGFVIQYGDTPLNLNQTITLNNPGIRHYVLTGVTGPQYVSIMALNSANITSDPTGPIQMQVTASTDCGPAPAPESRQQACTAPLVGNWTQTHGWSSVAAPACWQADPWTPDTAPAGVCASPPALKTAGPYGYCATGTTAAPTMTSIGYIDAGLTCGPTTRTLGAVKFCAVQPKSIDKVIFCPGDPALTKGAWAKSQ
jgi:hypothetical protein